jgi:hypothetical protein
LDALLTHFDKLDAEKVRMQWHYLKPCLVGELRSRYCDAPGISAWKVIAEELNEDDKFSELLKLVASVLVIPIASAVVERGFSIRNSLLLTKQRNQMNVETSEWQMRVMENGPEPYDYDESAATKARLLERVQYRFSFFHFLRSINGFVRNSCYCQSRTIVRKRSEQIRESM